MDYTPRALREQSYHNKIAKTIELKDLEISKIFESPTALENRYVLNELGDLTNIRLLDLGCGSGESSVYLASKGAEVHATDISDAMLQIAQKLALKHNVTIHTKVTGAEQLPYPDNYFDVVYGNGVLHHVELEPTASEVYRVLKPGGRSYFIEPLPYNPLIQIYRLLAGANRTEDEKPLTYNQIKQFGSKFSQSKHDEFWFLSLAIFLHFFLVRRWNPAKVKYFKKVLEVGHEYESMMKTLSKWDQKIFKIFPFLRPFSWNTVIQLIK